jgi:uncharacterized protein YcbX
MTIQISQLYHFPVKSLKGVSLTQMEVDDFGPKWDRRFMLIDHSGRFVTQRQCPMMGLIGVRVHNQQLILEYGDEQYCLNLDELVQFNQFCLVKVWGDEVNARLIEHDINAWLSNILQRDVQLCFIDDETHRQVDLDFSKPGDRASFSDGFPFLIISEESVHFLSEKLGRELAVARFRANIVVAGCEAFAEDEWKKIEINGIEFDIVKPCSRCVIPTFDLKTAMKQPDVMQVMLQYRKQGKQVMMGQNAIHRNEGALQLGNEIKIIA